VLYLLTNLNFFFVYFFCRNLLNCKNNTQVKKSFYKTKYFIIFCIPYKIKNKVLESLNIFYRNNDVDSRRAGGIGLPTPPSKRPKKKNHQTARNKNWVQQKKNWTFYHFGATFCTKLISIQSSSSVSSVKM